MLTSRMALTGLSIVRAMGGCAVRPLLRTQEGEISQPPALAAVVVVAVVGVDRRRQEASLQAEEVAEAEVVRLARVPDQVVGRAAAVQAAV
jgi:hypothetical protein